MGTCAAKGMNETWQKWWDYREREKEGGILPHQQFCNDFCHYTTSKTTWLPDFFSVHLITCMPYCIVFYRSDVLHHWQKKTCSVSDTVSTLLFPLGIFISVFISSRVKVQVHDDSRRRNDHVWGLRYHIRGTSTVCIQCVSEHLLLLSFTNKQFLIVDESMTYGLTDNEKLLISKKHYSQYLYN